MPANTLIQELFAAPYRFEFAQALALLEKCYPRKTPLGTGLDPRQETVRLSGPLYPQFYPSTLAALSKSSPRLSFRPWQQKNPLGLTRPRTKQRMHQSQLHMQVCHFGLGGPDGPLPYAYQEWLQERRQLKDFGPAAFMDLFHQRILGQLYRSQIKHQIAAPFTPPKASCSTPIRRALCGLLPAPLHERLDISDQMLLAHSPILANRRRSVEGFQALCASFFGHPVYISQFEGAWSDIPASHQSQLGGQNSRLGHNTTAGKKIWDEHAGIRLSLGPLSLNELLAYLPQGPRYKKLLGLAAFYFGPEMRCSVLLKLAPEAITACDSSKDQPARPFSPAAPPFLLGQTSWLGGSNPAPRQCLIAPQAALL